MQRNLDLELERHGLLRFVNGRARIGVLGFDRSRDGTLVAAADLGGVSVLDAATGEELARRTCLCARSGLVRFAVRDRVIVFLTAAGTAEAWEWQQDEGLGSFPLPEPPTALATCDRPVVATLLPGRVHVVDIVAGQSFDKDVDLDTTDVALSADGDDVIALTTRDRFENPPV